ncbi:hypothetical protein ACMFMF_008002 [Clarireedia jacksonii]
MSDFLFKHLIAQCIEGVLFHDVVKYLLLVSIVLHHYRGIMFPRIAIFLFSGYALLANALSTIESFYPPNLNDTSYISNSSLGTYGGSYQAPKGQILFTNTTYGAYYYCSMPHPRAEEYKLPGPIQNGSVKADIVYLDYLQRHQRRTPYNILPSGETVPFNCSDILTYLYAGPPSGQQPIPVYGQTYTSPQNPFLSTYIPGTCQYPQLTIGGLLDGYAHGHDLRSVYGTNLSLLPSTPSPQSTYFRSSESPLTQQSAGGVLRAVWPSYKGSLPLHQQATSVDTVNEGYSCPAISSTLSQIKSTTAWNDHISITTSLRATLGSMFNANSASSAWQQTFDHFADNFQGRLCNGYELPCSSITGDCVNQEMANEVFRAGDWEWNYYWRANPYVKKYIQLVEGLFIGEIVARLESVMNGTIAGGKYSHTFVHDGDIGPVAGALGINALRWPGMGSNIAFEVW